MGKLAAFAVLYGILGTLSFYVSKSLLARMQSWQPEQILGAPLIVSRNLPFIPLSLTVILLCAGCGQSSEKTETVTQQPPAASLPDPAKLEKVRFGMEPYADHTYAIIGVKKGWFKDVGIDLDYRCVKTDDVVPFLESETLDVASCPPAFLYSSMRIRPIWLLSYSAISSKASESWPNRRGTTRATKSS